METLQAELHAGIKTDDRELVEQAIKGDRSSFNRLVLKYRNPVVTLCSRLLNDNAEGEDAAQDAFVKAYESLRQFRGEALFSTWLYRIAVNICRNKQRSWWNRLFKSAQHLDRNDESDEQPQFEIGDNSMIPTVDLERKRLAATIKKALQTLPSFHRELVVLRDIEEKSYEEIEEITGINMGTIKSRLARARSALQKELKGLGDE